MTDETQVVEQQDVVENTEEKKEFDLTFLYDSQYGFGLRVGDVVMSSNGQKYVVGIIAGFGVNRKISLVNVSRHKNFITTLSNISSCCVTVDSVDAKLNKMQAKKLFGGSLNGTKLIGRLEI